ncbi:hypothetical protein KW794_01970 [Candidatus Saccharibacteria bacterium]|nr:hypothetical protein [Candidatus Saccharibacteria bacterium]
MEYWLRHLHPAWKGLIVFVIFAGLAAIVPIRQASPDVSNVLNATAIFYSILIGFYISSAMSNLSRLKTLVATETGALIAIYHIVKLSLPAKLDETREAIDKYIIKRFDYEISDYIEPTTKEFFDIFDVLKGAKGKSDGEAAAINYVAEAMYYVAQSRREASIVGARIVNFVSSILLYVLSVIIVASLFVLRGSGLESSLVAVLLSSAAVLSLLILHDVDGNRFGEEHFAIDTYQDVLKAIGKQPYYSKQYLRGFRYKPPEKNYRTNNT